MINKYEHIKSRLDERDSYLDFRFKRLLRMSWFEKKKLQFYVWCIDRKYEILE